MKRIIGIVVIMLVIGVFTSIKAQVNYKVKSHDLLIEGTSNVQSWSADVEEVNGTFKIKVEDGKIVDIESLSVIIEASSLKGSHGNMMNSKIYDALDTKKHPRITFDLSRINSINENTGSFGINTRGVLRISGVSQTVTLNVAGKVLPNGEIEFSGSTKLKMTDFNVKPPRAMFGALTTGDEVTLKYQVVVKPNLLSDN